MLKACYLRLNGIDKEVDQKYLYSVKGLRYLLTFRRHVCTIGLRSPLPRGSNSETTERDTGNLEDDRVLEGFNHHTGTITV